MSDSSGLIKFVLIGGAAYVAYSYFTQAAAVPVPTPPATTGGGAPPATTPPANTPPASTPPATTVPTFNSLDAIGARILAAAGSTPYTADQFNFYLAQQLPSGKVPPDPAAVFTQAGWDRGATMTFPQWWGVMAPYLRGNLGMSGLGVLHGLGLYIASKQAAY